LLEGKMAVPGEEPDTGILRKLVAQFGEQSRSFPKIRLQHELHGVELAVNKR
jgi:hypothetical protein